MSWLPFSASANRAGEGWNMETATLSTKYQLVLPRRVREHLRLRPGMRFVVITKGDVIFLILERPMRAFRGVAAGIRSRAVRTKKDRL